MGIKINIGDDRRSHSKNEHGELWTLNFRASGDALIPDSTCGTPKLKKFQNFSPKFFRH